MPVWLPGFDRVIARQAQIRELTAILINIVEG
jgi:hypothetical protein